MAVESHYTCFPSDKGSDLTYVVRLADYTKLEERAKELQAALASLVLHTKPAKSNAVALHNAHRVLNIK